jgi:hypothetical protein
MPLADAIGWAAGVSALIISGVAFLSALVSEDHLYVAGFISLFALTVYAMRNRGFEIDD